MKSLLARIDGLIDRDKLPWRRQGADIEVRFEEHGRKQTVRIDVHEGLCSFRSTVLGPAVVLQSKSYRQELAYRVWRRNASKDVVAFGFDSSDRLIGQIEQPLSTMDDAEILLYISSVARECDLFEYLLRGSDLS
jgi:hypothetical protein